MGQARKRQSAPTIKPPLKSELYITLEGGLRLIINNEIHNEVTKFLTDDSSLFTVEYQENQVFTEITNHDLRGLVNTFIPQNAPNRGIVINKTKKVLAENCFDKKISFRFYDRFLNLIAKLEGHDETYYTLYMKTATGWYVSEPKKMKIKR